jgi:two-component system cell cycle response regulator DivK
MIRVLYIEDEPLNIRLVQKMLNFSGCHVSIAETGAEGIAKAIVELPNVILLDINLPDIDGFEVARSIRATAASAHIPIIALTAQTLYGDREHSLTMGCDDYLPKPTSRIELLNKIHEHTRVNPLRHLKATALDVEQEASAS